MAKFGEDDKNKKTNKETNKEQDSKIEITINPKTKTNTLNRKVLDVDKVLEKNIDLVKGNKDVQTKSNDKFNMDGIEDKGQSGSKHDNQSEQKRGKDDNSNKDEKVINITEGKSSGKGNNDEQSNTVQNVRHSNKNAETNKSINSGSYTTDQGSLDSFHKDIEQQRIYAVATGSVLADQIQSDLRSQRIESDNFLQTKTSLGIELQGDQFIPKYNGSRKVVNACPQILQIVSEKVFNSQIIGRRSRYPFMSELPILQKSRDIFAEGTDLVRVILNTTNCNSNVNIDPQQQIRSSKSIFRNVLISQPGAVNPMYSTDSDTNIQHVFTAIFAFLPQLVKSCRVIYEIDRTYKEMLTNMLTDRINLYDDILNHLAIYKFPENYGVHLILGAADHGLEWFMEHIIEMLKNDSKEYRFGQVRTISKLKLDGKREVESIEATDQYAAALLQIDRMRRTTTKMNVATYITWLYQFSIPGVRIDHIKEHDEDDYEMEGIMDADSDSFIFCFLTSKSFQTAMIERIVKYLIDFNLVKSISLSENLKINRGTAPSMVREQLTAQMQNRLESVDVSTFIRLIVYDVMAIFVPVRYSIRATIHDELESFPDLFMNLVCIVLFKNIFAQNMHIIGFNICNFLYNIDYKPYMSFQDKHGFSSTHRVPALIDNDFYKNGEIPKIFDTSVSTKNEFIIKIRKLLSFDGEIFSVNEKEIIKSPRLETKPQGYIPYQRKERRASYENTELQDQLWRVIRIVEEVGLSYTKVTTNDKKTTISDYIKWVTSLKPLMKEFSAMMHHEGNFLYKLLMRHYACIYTDIKTADDYFLTEKLGLAIRSDTESDLEPFLIVREPIKISYTLPLSCVLTIEGIYSVISRYETNDVRITVPDPQVIFKEFYETVKGTRAMTEVLAMSRHILREDATGILSKLTRFAQHASKTVVYKEVLRMMADFTGNMPQDFLEYAEESINYTNNLKFWDPQIVFVNKINEVIEMTNPPELMRRTLILSDNFLAMEVDVVSHLLFESSFLFHINRGIRIFKQQVDYLTPSLPPSTWSTYKVRLVGHNNYILETRNRLGRPTVMFALYDDTTQTEMQFFDLSSCEVPKVLFICDHPSQIAPHYREEIFKLIKLGKFGFEFTNFWYQASTYYNTSPPSSYPDDYIKNIFETFDDTLKMIVFPDTSRRISFEHDMSNPQTQPHQYLWTTEDIQTDVLMKDINGNRPNPLVYNKPNPRNWALGKPGASVAPLFSDGSSKISSGVPNFLNTVIAKKKNTVNYAFPPVEITSPSSLLG